MHYKYFTVLSQTGLLLVLEFSLNAFRTKKIAAHVTLLIQQGRFNKAFLFSIELQVYISPFGFCHWWIKWSFCPETTWDYNLHQFSAKYRRKKLFTRWKSKLLSEKQPLLQYWIICQSEKSLFHCLQVLYDLALTCLRCNSMLFLSRFVDLSDNKRNQVINRIKHPNKAFR